jgi:predicted DNA-binding protein (UPF0251 family)/DNA-directed RNA polymerase subunit RPC12/RpoP
MARPTKWRRIENLPEVCCFVPSHTQGDGTNANTLKLEELEAVRLKDLAGLEQEECADRMGVSRPTFQRILLSAREKIADSLVHGKAIHIEGGNFTQNICHVTCLDCGRAWPESIENLSSNEDSYTCPGCGSKRIVCEHACSVHHGRGACRRFGRHT